MVDKKCVLALLIIPHLPITIRVAGLCHKFMPNSCVSDATLVIPCPSIFLVPLAEGGEEVYFLVHLVEK